MDYPIHRYAIVRARFDDGVDRTLPGAGGNFSSTEGPLYDVFFNHADSVRNFWHRAAFGLVDLQFTVLPGYYTLEGHRHRDGNFLGGRSRTLDAVRRVLAENDVSLDGFQHLITVLPSWPTDAGASGGDIAFNLGPATTMAFLQHEVGHTLGLQHAFGPYAGQKFDHLYNDPYCVMGYTGTQSHATTVPPASSWQGVLAAGPGFWVSERRPSAAALYRRYKELFFFTGRVWDVSAPPRNGVRIHGLCSVTDPAKPQAAVLGVPNGTSAQKLIVEYRTATGDDTGVAPGVVIHSIGVHPVGPGRNEVDPPWYEGTIPAVIGSQLNVLGMGFTVSGVSSTAPEFVEVDIAPAPPPPTLLGWRWCSNCQCLAYADFGGPPGPCHDGSPHNYDGSGRYAVIDGRPGMRPVAQAGWRACQACHLLAFAGFGSGMCVSGGQHRFAVGSYQIPIGQEPTVSQQGGWRWCSRCQNMTFSGYGTGACIAGGGHEIAGSSIYNLYYRP
ncbi:hypothetical protein [Myceligenerans crystallogenes]|uniref:Uncharacterized protein n=1 Tax=Myceligenerans crystallogenes TaxID=316335 RepID=A0ABN2NLL3_9MICO